MQNTCKQPNSTFPITQKFILSHMGFCLSLAIGCALYTLDYGCKSAHAENDSITTFDRIVVVVSEKIITQKDIALENALTHMIPSTSSFIQYNRELDAKEGLIQIQLLKLYAGDISLYKPTEAEILSRFTTFRKSWSSITEYNLFLATNGIDDNSIISFIRVLCVAENYTKKNIGTIEVSMEDPNWSKEHEKYQRWISEAKNSVSIRYVRNFALP